MAGFEIPLVLLVFGYFEPGTATAAANGLSERLCFQCGTGTPLFPGLPHRLGPGCRRTLFVFGSFGGCGHPPIKNCENIPAQDYGLPAAPPERRQRWQRAFAGFFPAFSFLGAAKTRRSCCRTWDGVHGRFGER